MLWAYVLYTGVITTIINPATTSGRPAEWVLPLVAKILSAENEQWYKDAKEGYKFDIPPSAELLRVAIFVIVGFYVNLAWINVLDGDTFWGWSTATCLAIPSLLIDLSRKEAPTRKQAVLERQLEQHFKAFTTARISFSEDATCSEDRIVRAFRREYAQYRNQDIIPDKVLIKAIRQHLKIKPNYEGYYLKLLLTTRTQEGKKALAATQKRLEQERQLLLQGNGAQQVDASSGFDNEFVRR